MTVLREKTAGPGTEEQGAETFPAPRPSAPARRAELVLAICFTAGLALYWVPLRGVNLDAMSGYGLISVLPVATFVGAATLVLTFFGTLALGRPRRTLLGLQLVALVLALHGLAPALEAMARPPTAWQHLGIVEYITRTGEPHVMLDARYSWPAFFAAVGFITRAAGIEDIEPFMHWSPVGLELLYLGAYYLILRAMWAHWRAKWTAAWLLVAADWVGQDYFAPQGFGYLLYLVFLGILLNWFMPARDEETRNPLLRLWPPRLAGLTPGERLLMGQPGPGERTAVFAILLGIVAVTLAAHQLTPFIMLFTATALVLVGRCTLRWLPLLMVVLTAAWMSYMTKAYWEGQGDSLFSGIGNLFETLGSSVSGRITESSAQLALVQQTRILIAVAVVLLAVLGLCRRWRQRFDDRVAVVLLCVPFLSIGLQNYGGEITLRVYLFILPGACLLAAYLFFPRAFTVARPFRAVAAAAVCGLLVAGSFLFVRFGNETYERVRPGEVQAFREMLRLSPEGRISLVWQIGRKGPMGSFPQAPWGMAAQERWDYVELEATREPENIKPIVDALKVRPGSYFLTTRSNEALNHYVLGLPADHGPRLVRALRAAPELKPVLLHEDAAVFTLRKPTAGTPPKVTRPLPFTVGKTPWTPVGVLATVLLVALLATREIARLHGRDRLPVPRGFGYVVWPLFALSVFVVLERFHTLGSG
ncbi:hypothetical protein SAMN04489712_10285 [Thermomonospora echinospora]|uniref:Uncharacterized protein n=1 Tax=Thermomonospora echinospora TaxID=1992 RepID=A0A1H5V0F9_9ACTN|nr:hypothetical protein [Thermomonospora echinospora]SEF79967.1 hypothetical protein SAMN04489712_10285 [Thermomonospora echinospora]